MKHILPILTFTCLGLLSSCTEIGFGNGALSDPPENSGATLESLFTSIEDADKVLVSAYSYLPYGIPTDSDNRMGGNILEAITDLHYSSRNNISDGPRNLYYTGSLSANITPRSQGTEAYRFGSENDYTTIRYAWIFIENAHRIPNVSEKIRRQKIAEAKMLLAISYFNMLHYCGGVPILDHAIDVNEPMNFPRNTFAETVNFIVRMLDEAKNDLPWKQNEINDGRMTKAGALGLKLRVLCFAASPTFNSDTPYHPSANEYSCYMNYDHQRWVDAKNAADEFMEALAKHGYYGLVKPTAETHKARRLAYRKGYYNRGTTETLISIREGFTGVHDYFISNFANSHPTLNWVNMYPWEDGTDFPEDFDWENPSKQPFFTPDGTGKAPGIPTRDPRLYENIAVPGDIFHNGTVVPAHINSPRYNPLGTGFYAMKFVLQENNDRNGVPNHWPYLRYAEVLLNAAEAYNEADERPTPTAYKYVNEVRARVGLPGLPEGLDRVAFRKALLRERALEFGYEEIRWFDLIRWGMVEDFQKPLYMLKCKGNELHTPTEFTFYKPIRLQQRAWESGSWDTKWYLSPIPQLEIDRNYGMTQNPGW